MEGSNSQGNDDESPKVGSVIGIVVFQHIVQLTQVLVELVDRAYFLVWVKHIINDPATFRDFREPLLQEQKALWL